MTAAGPLATTCPSLLQSNASPVPFTWRWVAGPTAPTCSPIQPTIIYCVAPVPLPPPAFCVPASPCPCFSTACCCGLILQLPELPCDVCGVPLPANCGPPCLCLLPTQPGVTCDTLHKKLNQGGRVATQHFSWLSVCHAASRSVVRMCRQGSEPEERRLSPRALGAAIRRGRHCRLARRHLLPQRYALPVHLAQCGAHLQADGRAG